MGWRKRVPAALAGQVGGDEAPQVHIDQGVAVEDQERLRETVKNGEDRAGRAIGTVFDEALETETPLRAVAAVSGDGLGAEAAEYGYVTNAEFGEELELVGDEGLAEDRDQRFGQAASAGGEPSSLPASYDDGELDVWLRRGQGLDSARRDWRASSEQASWTASRELMRARQPRRLMRAVE